RLVAMRLRNAALKVVDDDAFRNAADVGEGALMRADPVRQRLRPSRFGERVARGAEHGDEDFRFLDLAGAPIDDRRLLSGVVDEQRLAGAVVLPHDHIDLARPRAVVLTEPAVVKALRMRGLVLLPEQEERHALALELA